MKIGVKLPNSGPLTNAEGIKRVALAAESLGFDSVWVHDHVHRTALNAEHHFVAGAVEAWKRPVVPDMYEAMSTLHFVAGMTRRIQVGSSIIVLPLRNPVWLAKEAATLDQLSGGRLILGVGQGGGPYIRDELAAMGEPGRGDHLRQITEEWIEVIRAVWRDDVVNYEGQHITVRDAEVFPKPSAGSLPIWYGGASRAGRRRTAKLCDGWLPMFLLPEEIRQGMSEIREIALTAGRDPSAIVAASEHWLAIDRDGDRARRRSEATRTGIWRYVQQMPHATNETESPEFHLGRVDQANLVGDPDLIGERVQRYRSAGVDHLILRVIAHSLDELVESLQLFRESVMEPA